MCTLVMVLFGLTNYAQSLTLLKKNRVKEIDSQSYITVRLESSENRTGDQCSSMLYYGRLHDVLSDSIYLQLMIREQVGCLDGKQVSYQFYDFHREDSTEIVALCKRDIVLIELSSSYKFRNTKAKMASIFTLAGYTGLVLVVGGFAIEEDKGDNLSVVGLWMLAVGIVGNRVMRTQRKFHTSRVLKPNKKSVWEIQ